MAIPSEDLKRELRTLIANCDMSKTTVKEIRKQLEKSLSVDLSAQKDEIKEMVTSILQEAEAEEEDESGEDFEEDAESVVASPTKRRTNGEDSYEYFMSEELMALLGRDDPKIEYRTVSSSLELISVSCSVFFFFLNIFYSFLNSRV